MDMSLTVDGSAGPRAAAGRNQLVITGGRQTDRRPTVPRHRVVATEHETLAMAKLPIDCPHGSDVEICCGVVLGAGR